MTTATTIVSEAKENRITEKTEEVQANLAAKAKAKIQSKLADLEAERKKLELRMVAAEHPELHDAVRAYARARGRVAMYVRWGERVPSDGAIKRVPKLRERAAKLVAQIAVIEAGENKELRQKLLKPDLDRATRASQKAMSVLTKLGQKLGIDVKELVS